MRVDDRYRAEILVSLRIKERVIVLFAPFSFKKKEEEAAWTRDG